jgi:hypothetical protein
MTFYNTLESIKEYFVSFRKLETYLSLDLKFPDTWSMPKSTTTDYQVVPFEINQQGSRGMSFVCEMNEVEVEKNITMIQKIIRLNKERELKEVLFKEVMSELKKTFETNDLESLKRLNFHFENEKPKIEDLDHELGGESLELVE